MANTEFQVGGKAELETLLDANVGQISSATWDATGNKLTLSLVGGDTITIGTTVDVNPETMSLAQMAEQLYPRIHEKDGQRLEMFNPKDVVEATRMQRNAQTVPFNKIRRYRLVHPENNV
jgi:hypothetical protein